MQRTFNYTNRHRIEQTEAQFRIIESKGKNPSFEVDLHLHNKGYPDYAKLYVEAYYKETRQRFDFGCWSKQFRPKSLELSQIDLSGSPLFRILIVDETKEHSLILASGSNFRIFGEDGNSGSRQGLLPVRALNLGGLVWSIDFEPETPELLINSIIPNSLERMRSDPVFQGLILPMALRQILNYLFFESDLDHDHDVCLKWLNNLSEFTDIAPNEIESNEERTKWLDDITEAFAAKFEFASKLLDGAEEKRL